MSTTSTTPSRRWSVSPMRMIRQLLFRMRSFGHDSIELDVVEHQVSRELQEVSRSAAEAEAFEAEQRAYRDKFRAAVAAGAIPLPMARELAKEQIAFGEALHRHAERLEALSS